MKLSNKKDETSQQDFQARLDRITYLASLISNKAEIDPYFDDLRIITARARIQGAQHLASRDDQKLTDIERRLRDYLLRKEPLRTFTEETLEQQIYERLQATSLIRGLRWQTCAIFALAVLATAWVMSLPFSSRGGLQATIGGTTLITALYLGGLYLFYSCLKRFSAALRSIYVLFCVAFLFGSATVLANLAITVAYAAHAPWQVLWPVNLGFCLSYVLMYIASRRLAKLHGLSSRMFRTRIVAGVAVGAPLLLALTPAGRMPDPINGMMSWPSIANACLLAAAGWLMYRVWQNSNDRYRATSRAMCVGLFASIGTWAETTVSPYLPVATHPALTTISNLCGILATFCLLRAAYFLNKLSRQ